MKVKEILYVLFLVVGMLLANSVEAKLSVDDERVLANGYRTLRRFEEPYSVKKKAVTRIKVLFEKTGDRKVIDYVVNLLKYNYDYDKFDEQNDQMFYNDRIARDLIVFIGEAKDPKGFEVMVTYVMKMNHTDDTIRQVWWAIQEIDWTITNR